MFVILKTAKIHNLSQMFTNSGNRLNRLNSLIGLSLRKWHISTRSSSNYYNYCLQEARRNFKYYTKATKKQETISAPEEIKPPLNGVRILDMSRVLAGPYCTMILGDMGAEVIKVERPDVGDDTRAWGPPFVASESCYFLCVNRNKKSITVDLKKPQGVKLIKELAAISDVLVENYIPGKLSEMGLGYPELSAEFPHLVYCSITGYGQTGEYASRAGYDVIVSGLGGLMNITGPADGDPCKVGVALTDLSTGLYGVSAILASLLSRQQTGRGQHLDCNLLSTNVTSLVNIASNFLNTGQEGQRYGTAHPSIVPYQAFKTSDGFIIVGAGNDSQFKILAQCIGHPALANDERYATNKARVKNRDVLLQFLFKIFEEKSLSDWLKIFENSGIPYGPINNMKQVFSDPQVLHNGLIQEIPHPTIGKVRVVGPAVRYSETKTVEPTAPPLLGQHTHHVLKDILGYSEDAIEKLKKHKVV
ncbi:succinate--hydroxymethylglutarate CoA-transferase-like isoform X1 [Biomphalaria glabrata]|uniref:Succinate--hydroxymethylglutarate CoA-transferase-like isoform X1 n=1 Tax=Biomphalaria glabrata TaxID=6526 RepID=A0A9U8EIG6_BIOGL|nr:succinate--hydroxymethylglutarate CoA-transferase-like isoform X1 [Biomphalaria glabrata]